MTLTAISKERLRTAILNQAIEIARTHNLPCNSIPIHPLIIEKPEVICISDCNWEIGPKPDETPNDAWEAVCQAARELATQYRLTTTFLGGTATNAL